MTGLGQLHTTGAHGAARHGLAFGRKVQEGQWLGMIGECARVFEIPAGAEGTALAPEHGDRCIRIGVERLEGRDQSDRAVRIHRVACFGATVDDRRDRPIALHSYAHVMSPPLPVVPQPEGSGLFASWKGKASSMKQASAAHRA